MLDSVCVFDGQGQASEELETDILVIIYTYVTVFYKTHHFTQELILIYDTFYFNLKKYNFFSIFLIFISNDSLPIALSPRQI